MPRKTACQGDLIVESEEHGTLEVRFWMTPGDPGCWYQKNGDPGWPATEDEYEYAVMSEQGPINYEKLSEDDQERIAVAAREWVLEWSAYGDY